MFSHLLPNEGALFSVAISEYAKKHFLKRFEKDYRGQSWKMTIDAIVDDLVHLGHGDYDLQRTQQVDELWHEGDLWVFKYDFRVAGTRMSAKTSGNRVVAVLNSETMVIEIVMIYGKTDLPKNMGETQYIKQVVNEVCPEIGWR